MVCVHFLGFSSAEFLRFKGMVFWVYKYSRKWGLEAVGDAEAARGLKPTLRLLFFKIF